MSALTRTIPAILALCASLAGAACEDPTDPPGPGPAAAVVITPSADTVNFVGDSVRFSATVRDADGEVIPDAAVVWSAPDGEHLKVRGDGTAVPSIHPTPLAVVATVGTVSDTAWLLARQVPAAVEIDTTDLRVVEFSRLRLGAVVRDSGGTALLDSTGLRWESSDSSIVFVEPTGTLIPWGTGSAWISARAAGLVDSLRVTVEPMEPVRFVSVDAGYVGHTCALTDEGRAFCWGRGRYGALGLGTTGLTESNRPVPVSTDLRFEQIIAGNRHSCGLTASGEVWCWGEASFITGLADNRCAGLPCALVPARIEGLPPVASLHGTRVTCALTVEGGGYCFEDMLTEPFPDLEIRSLATTEHHHCALDTGGGVWCRRRAGGEAWREAPDSSFASITGGYAHLCGIADDRSAACWGHNFAGQLGVGNVFTQDEPTAVAGGHAFASLSGGGWTSGHDFDRWVPAGTITCGVSAEGAGYCWGANHVGQVGNGASEPHCQAWIESSPCEVSPREVANVPGFVSISAAGYFACGIGRDGVLYCWGGGLPGLGTGMDDLPGDDCVASYECSRTPLPVYGQRLP